MSNWDMILNDMSQKSVQSKATIEIHTIDEWDEIGECLWKEGKRDKAEEIGLGCYVRYEDYKNLMDKLGEFHKFLDEHRHLPNPYVQGKFQEIFSDYFVVEKKGGHEE